MFSADSFNLGAYVFGCLFSQTSEILAALAAVFAGYNHEEKAAQLKKVRSRTPSHRSTVLSKRRSILSRACARCAERVPPYSFMMTK